MKNVIIKAMASFLCSLFLCSVYAQQKTSEGKINNTVDNELTLNNADTSQSHRVRLSSLNKDNEQHEEIIIQDHNKISKTHTLQIPANLFPANVDTLQRKSR